MKKFSFLSLFLITAVFFQVQGQTNKLYNPDADARLEISKAVKQASAEGKHVLIMVGGNW